MKKIILCADDFGQNEEISTGISTLVAMGRLSAVSCMTNGPAWNATAKWLHPWRDHIDIGLHLNLTEGPALYPPASTCFSSLPQLIISSKLRWLSLELITQEFHRQLDAFIGAMGKLPDFVDGHQYIHHLPQVSTALLQVYRQRLAKHGAYIRCVTEPNWLARLRGPGKGKRGLMQMIFTGHFQQQLLTHAIPHNTSFAGIYPFQHANRYPHFFPQFLTQIQSGGLIVCHPGKSGADKTDPLNASRSEEYAYLQSDQFKHDCAAQQVTLHRFGALSL